MSLRKNLLVVLAPCCLAAPMPGALAQQQDDSSSSLLVGAGVATLPEYEGSDEHRRRALPVIAGHYRSGIGKFSLGGTGLGFGLAWTPVENELFEAGLLTGFSREREENDSARLRGMGDIDMTPEFGAFGTYKIGALQLRVAGMSAIGSKGHGGAHVDTSLSRRFVLSDKISLRTHANVTWASDDYMQNMFGVTEEQASRSAHATYQAESGVKSTGAGVAMSYSIDGNWGLLGTYAYSRLMGDAANSPIVQQRNQHSASVGVTYRW